MSAACGSAASVRRRCRAPWHAMPSPAGYRRFFRVATSHPAPTAPAPPFFSGPRPCAPWSAAPGLTELPPRRQQFDEAFALLGEQFDGVGGQELVVADRGRDRVR